VEEDSSDHCQLSFVADRGSVRGRGILYFKDNDDGDTPPEETPAGSRQITTSFFEPCRISFAERATYRAGKNNFKSANLL
jgi:hypothetical protein